MGDVSIDRWRSEIVGFMVGKAHPDVCELIEVFQRKEAAITVTISQLEAGVKTPPRKRKAKEIDRRISDFTSKVFGGGGGGG